MILAIDPGPVKSAWLMYDPIRKEPTTFKIEANSDVLDRCKFHGGTSRGVSGLCPLVIEMIASYGMPVGVETFETCTWIGRFEQAYLSKTLPVNAHRLYRKQIVTHLCGSARAKDANVRRALLDRFGGDAAGKKGGALYGISKDAWSALAIAVTFADLRKAGQI